MTNQKCQLQAWKQVHAPPKTGRIVNQGEHIKHLLIHKQLKRSYYSAKEQWCRELVVPPNLVEDSLFRILKPAKSNWIKPDIKTTTVLCLLTSSRSREYVKFTRPTYAKPRNSQRDTSPSKTKEQLPSSSS